MDYGYAPSGAASIHYWVEGNGPAILFLHAGVADSRMWRGQMDLPGYRSIAFDQRGFGRTTWVREPYADWRDAVAVLDSLDVASATVVGCSLGGGIAMHLALTVPDRVDGLVLVGAAARGWEPRGGWPHNPLWDEAVAAYEAGNMDRVIDLDAEIWLAGVGRTLTDIDPDVVKLFLDMDRVPAATEQERSGHVESFEPPVNDRLDDIVSPTLVMVGQHDQPDMVESAHYLAERLSEGPPVVIENAAHLPSLESPEAFNSAMTSFLDRLQV